MIIWKIGITLHFGIVLYPPFGCTTTLLKPHTSGHLPYSNFKIGKLNTPTNLPSFPKYCLNVHVFIQYTLLGGVRNGVKQKSKIKICNTILVRVKILPLCED